MQQQRRQHGFTLIELMVVVAIIGIFSAVMMGMMTRPYSANAKNVSEQITASLNLAKTRTVATRAIHKVTITPQSVLVEQALTRGFVADPSTLTYALVERLKIPNGVTIHNFDPTVRLGSGNTVTTNASLTQTIYFKPDGSSTGGTIYIADTKPLQRRILVYKFTGGVRVADFW